MWEQEDDRHKRRAHNQLDGKELGKKIHFDPFAQLEQNLINQEMGDGHDDREQKSSQPLLKHKIREDVNLEVNFYHHIFIPEDVKRSIGNQDVKSFYEEFGDNALFKRLFTVLSCSESAILECSESECPLLVLNIIKFFSKGQMNIIYSSLDALCSERKRFMKSQFLDVQSQNSECLFFSLRKLRKTIFENIGHLDQVKYLIFEIQDFTSEENMNMLEQILITLPLNINYLIIFRNNFENSKQFTSWLCSLRVRPFHLLLPKRKENRPIFFIYPHKGQGLFQITLESGQILSQYLLKINKQIDENKDKKLKKPEFIKQTMKTLYSMNLLPMVYHCFKKKDVEEYARIICQSFDFTSQQQKNKIEKIYEQTLVLLDEQKNMKEISIFKEYLVRGIGIFHQGLLPLLKQLIQLLSREGLLSIIFTNQTQTTFEAQSVFFIDPKRQNCAGTSWLKPEQKVLLIQKAKIVVMYVSQKLTSSQLESMLSLNINFQSNFRIDLHRVLNYQNFEDMDSKYILERTFKQYQRYQQIPHLQKECSELQNDLNSIIFGDEQITSKLTAIKTKKKELEQKWRKMMFTPQKVVPYLCVGRIVKLKDNQTDWGWGVIVNIHKIQDSKKLKVDSTKFYLDILVYITIEERDGKNVPSPTQLTQYSTVDEKHKFGVLTFDFSVVSQISTLKISVVPNNLNDPNSLYLIFETLKNIRLINPKSIEIECGTRQALDLKYGLIEVNKEIQQFSYLEEYYQTFNKYEKIKEGVNNLKKDIKEKGEIISKKQLKGYIKVLKHFQLIQKGSLTLKGKAAKNINSPFVIILMELINQDFFKNASPVETAALVVSLIEWPKSTTARYKVKVVQIREKIVQILDTCKKVSKVYRDSKLDVTEEDFSQNVKECFIEAVIKWCQGENLSQICALHEIFEGTFVKIIHKLLCLLNQLKNAAHILGLKKEWRLFCDTVNLLQKGLCNTVNIFEM